MVSKRIVDYYAVLNVPASADLEGVENAYSRLSRELAGQIAGDESAALALERLNEAYEVLGRPKLRREYDRVYFSKEIADLQARQASARLRQKFTSGLIMAGLGLVVTGQSIALVYIGRSYISDAADTLFGSL